MSSRPIVSVRGGSGDAENKAESAVDGIESTILTETSLTRHDGVRKIDHVAMVAHDADAASQWFEEVLGLQRIHDEVVHDVGVRLLWLAPKDAIAGEASFQIFQPLGPGTLADFLAKKRRNAPRLLHRRQR